jgi:flagellar hook assembly protein FlgD
VGAPLPASGAGPVSLAAPNPTSSGTAIRLARPASRVAADILDVRGAIVRTLGAPPFHWDGRDANGAPVPAGVYFYRLRGDVQDAGRVVILR